MVVVVVVVACALCCCCRLVVVVVGSGHCCCLGWFVIVWLLFGHLVVWSFGGLVVWLFWLFGCAVVVVAADVFAYLCCCGSGLECGVGLYYSPSYLLQTCFLKKQVSCGVWELV